MANDTGTVLLPTQTFVNETTLTLGNTTVELVYGGRCRPDEIFSFMSHKKNINSGRLIFSGETSCNYPTCAFLYSIL